MCSIDGAPSGQDRFGFLIYTGPSPSTATAEAYGTWAYTAP